MLLAWIGFLSAMQISIVVGVAYVCYRYVYCPWEVMRKDIQGLATTVGLFESRLQDVKDSIIRKSQLLTEEEVSAVERRLLTKSRVRGAS